ncbi:hypothetical protein SGRIM128S_06075 [Streptomyces griseomycini]
MATREADREFWRGVLGAGGSTTVPRWTLRPTAGVDEHEATIPDDVVNAVRRLAQDLAVPLDSGRWPRTPRCSPRCRASATSRPATSWRRAAGRCPAG